MDIANPETAKHSYDENQRLWAKINQLRAALADVIPLAGMANLTPESQAKLERAKHVFDSLR